MSALDSNTPHGGRPPGPDAAGSAPGGVLADLAADTQVRPIPGAPGCYAADLPAHWNFLMPSGGVLMTVALRAIGAELADAGLRPCSATTIFCQPVPHGPLSIRVDILRRGNVAAQARATLASPGMSGPGLEVSATFARERTGAGMDALRDLDKMGSEAPAGPAPEELAPAADGLPGNIHANIRFFDNFDIRMAAHQRWWRADWQPGSPRLERWFRYRVPQRYAAGLPHGSADTSALDPGDASRPLDPLCLPPLVDTMAGALYQLRGGQREIFAPSLDLTVHFLLDTTSEWLLAASRLRHVRGGYASADIELWAAERTLVAYGTQTMIIRSAPR